MPRVLADNRQHYEKILVCSGRANELPFVSQCVFVQFDTMVDDSEGDVLSLEPIYVVQEALHDLFKIYSHQHVRIN